VGHPEQAQQLTMLPAAAQLWRRHMQHLSGALALNLLLLLGWGPGCGLLMQQQ
jgi:hypothetical protein